ncbi:uncharacterized protein UDID_18413 [Ustilago sp. UG-2017a]|nr:uncharacterized protein UDID_18413 [Ustilago sp. UG-2017a]
MHLPILPQTLLAASTYLLAISHQMTRCGLQDQQPREASSDASLWEELDDAIKSLTPPLPSTPTQVEKILGVTRKPGSKRGRSSLLDQTDAIKCQGSSGSSVQASGKTTDACQPLPPSKSAKTNGKARATAEEIDKVVAANMFKMSCSPPSSPPPGSRIKSISDMPAEEQQWYYCLAFEEGSSSSSSPGNMGVTSKGEGSKTWQTTWDNSNQSSTSTFQPRCSKGIAIKYQQRVTGSAQKVLRRKNLETGIGFSMFYQTRADEAPSVWNGSLVTRKQQEDQGRRLPALEGEAYGKQSHARKRTKLSIMRMGQPQGDHMIREHDVMGPDAQEAGRSEVILRRVQESQDWAKREVKAEFIRNCSRRCSMTDPIQISTSRILQQIPLESVVS